MVGNVKDLEKVYMNSDTIKDVNMQVLVSPKEGWDSHVMRVFEVGVGGFTPQHQHPWEHINYILEGQGSLMIGEEVFPLQQGSYAYVPQNTIHQFKNVGDTVFKFICIVPTRGHKIY